MSREPEKLCTQRAAHYRAADIHDKLIINLRDLNHIIRSLHDGKASQKRILIILSQMGSITQRDLTQRLGIQPGSASEVIAKLENAGCIVRTVSEEDRRTANLSLTQRGKQLATEAMQQRRQLHAEMFSCLTEEEKSTLQALLETINEDWTSRYQMASERRAKSRSHDWKCGRDERND